MPQVRIAPILGAIGDPHPRLGLIPEPLRLEQLALECREGRFAHGVVVRIARNPSTAGACLLAAEAEGKRGVLLTALLRGHGPIAWHSLGRKAYLEGADREHFVVLLLDTQNEVIGIHTVTVGRSTPRW